MLKFCGCKACRQGRKTARNQAIICRKKRSLRRKAKVDLARDNYDPPRKVSVGYTD